jgi:hypothetical protein
MQLVQPTRSLRLTSPSPADKALEADGARPMRLTRLKRPSTSDKANGANRGRPMRPTRLKRPSPANKADKANGAKLMGLMRALVGSILVGIIGAGDWMNNADSPVHERRPG